MKKIVFTGGGSAGHAVPNIALMQELQKKYSLFYIGTDGIERGLVEPLAVPYYTVDCPKFIRGFAPKNLDIPRRLHRAVREAEKILSDIRPNLVFSKGGYVALPVVFAARRLRIPALTHESDLSLGLANRLMASRCRYVLTSFPSLAQKLPNGRYSGSPMRNSLFGVNAGTSRRKYGFDGKKPVILVLGGGSGSIAVNNAVRKNLSLLLKNYDILHLCGKGNIEPKSVAGYIQREFEADMGSAYACADGVVCRAGSNTVFETLALKKPTLFIPLQNSRSRGDQVKNAEYFRQKGLCHILYESELDRLPSALCRLFADENLPKKLAESNISCGNAKIIRVMEECMQSSS
jgi:UDP-N-acetylglucosamine--N-acetylmuramyl-(pentapeptide) pyrophosphoryl-undecaprenol N-acetylglucosamine transferase